MRRLLLALLFIALIVGIAYVKDRRDSESRQEVYAEGLHEGRKSGEEERRLLDSLQDRVRDVEQALTDSTARQAEAFADRFDSLTLELARRDSMLEDSGQKAGGPASGTPTVDSLEIVRQRELTILAHYKQLYLALPADLSAYEKRVALDEIRQKTAMKYNVSLTELNRLRDRHNISY